MAKGWGWVESKGPQAMTRVIEKDLLVRANDALLRTAVVGGMAACAVAASIYDVATWLRAW